MGLGGSGQPARGWGRDRVRVPPLHGRKKLLEYLYSLKQPDGSFLMHIGGEVDVRWASAAVLGAGGATPGAGRRGGERAPRRSRAPVSRRSAYCAASVASLTNIVTPTLFAGTAEWIAR